MEKDSAACRNGNNKAESSGDGGKLSVSLRIHRDWVMSAENKENEMRTE